MITDKKEIELQIITGINLESFVAKARSDICDDSKNNETYKFYQTDFSAKFLTTILYRIEELFRTAERDPKRLAMILSTVEPNIEQVREIAETDTKAIIFLDRIAAKIYATMKNSSIENHTDLFNKVSIQGKLWNQLEKISQNPIWRYRVKEKRSLSEKWLKESAFSRIGPVPDYEQLPTIENTLHLVSYLSYIGGHNEALRYLANLDQNAFIKWQSFTNLINYCTGFIEAGQEGQSIQSGIALLEKASREDRGIIRTDDNYFFVNVYSGLSSIASRIYFPHFIEEHCTVNRDSKMPCKDYFQRAINYLKEMNSVDKASHVNTDELTKKLDNIELILRKY